MTEATTNQEPEIQDNDDAPIDTSARQTQIRLAHTALHEALVEISHLRSILDNAVNMLPNVSSSDEEVDVSYVAFSHVSKDIRNKLLDTIIERLGSTEDSVKAAFRSLKGVKRVRLTDEQIDSLILNRNSIVQ